MRHPSWRYLQTEGSYSLIPNSLMAVGLSGQVPGWEGTLSPIARLVLLALASRARLRVKSADEKELAALLGVDPRTARKALMDLWEAGLVEVDSPGRYRLAGGLPQGGHAGPQALRALLHALQGGGGENGLPEGDFWRPEIKEEVKEEKDLPHPHPPAQAEEEEEKEASEEEVAQPPQGEGDFPEASPTGEDLPATPSSADEPSVLSNPPPPLVKAGTKPLQGALKGAGLWGEFYKAFRPGFPSEALWAAYLARLEREALPKGEVFLQALALTLRGVAQGGVRYPARYLEAVMADLEARTPAPPPPPGGTRDGILDGALLHLPDGRRGYFAGWTGGGAKAFVEVDGVAHLVDRELVLAARVVG
jgi:DNA-binding transcriptional ArsR family regulator